MGKATRVLALAALAAAGMFLGSSLGAVPFRGYLCTGNWACANGGIVGNCDLTNPPIPPGSVPSCVYTGNPLDGCLYFQPYGCPGSDIFTGALCWVNYNGCR